MPVYRGTGCGLVSGMHIRAYIHVMCTVHVQMYTCITCVLCDCVMLLSLLVVGVGVGVGVAMLQVAILIKRGYFN